MKGIKQLHEMEGIETEVLQALLEYRALLKDSYPNKRKEIRNKVSLLAGAIKSE